MLQRVVTTVQAQRIILPVVQAIPDRCVFLRCDNEALNLFPSARAEELTNEELASI